MANRYHGAVPGWNDDLESWLTSTEAVQGHIKSEQYLRIGLLVIKTNQTKRNMENNNNNNKMFLPKPSGEELRKNYKRFLEAYDPPFCSRNVY